jgi:hypothetical protein
MDELSSSTSNGRSPEEIEAIEAKERLRNQFPHA